MSLLKEQIVNVILDVNNGLVGGAVESQLKWHVTLIDMVIKAKENGIELDSLILPYFSDNLNLGIDAMLSSRTVAGVRGGLAFQMVSVGGEYGSQKQQGIRVKIDRNFKTINAPDFERYNKMSVQELRDLSAQVGTQIEQLEKADEPQVAES